MAADPTGPERRGVGIGLRWEFLDELLLRVEAGTIGPAEVPFFEISPENYLRRGGYVVEALQYVAERFPIITHGLHMSLGSVDPFRDDYFAGLREVLDRLGAPWHSDHLCFSGVDGRALHDLLPLPQTEAAALHAAARVREARDRLERPMAIENISWYLRLGAPQLDEAEFVSLALEQADCGMLLDVNNVYVNSRNHGFDAREWIDRIDMSRVWQLHVAGHEYRQDDGFIIDTHGQDVIDPVYDLFRYTIAKKGPCAVILERDGNIPALDVLLAERKKLQRAYEAGIALHRASHAA